MKDRVVALIRAAVPRIASQVETELRFSIRVSPQLINEDDLPAAASRVGGRPALPGGVAWPEQNEQPLGFIAQFNLAEVAPYDIERMLPDRGMLYFFYDADKQPWGFGPEERDSWRVIYYIDSAGAADDKRRLLLREIPEKSSKWNQFPCATVSFSSELTVPPYNSLFIDSLNLTDEEGNEYLSLAARIAELYGTEELDTHLLGHPDPIQGEMQTECQLSSNGLNYDDPRAEEFREGAIDWQLLFQVDSIEELHMQWGDAGLLYYWIRRQDLARLDFSQVWVILQCF